MPIRHRGIGGQDIAAGPREDGNLRDLADVAEGRDRAAGASCHFCVISAAKWGICGVPDRQA